MIEIKLGTKDSWDTIRSLRLESLIDSPDAFTSSYEKESSYTDQEWESRFRRGQWFLAELDREPAGIACCIHPQDYPDNKRELVSMWIKPEARGKGVSKKLVEAVLDWALTNGVSRVGLSVITGNVPAQKLYENCGFKVTQTDIDVGDNSGRTYNLLETTFR